MIWFVIILTLCLCFLTFMITYDAVSYRYEKRKLNEKLREVNTNNANEELAADKIRFKIEMTEKEFKHDIENLIFGACFIATVYICALFSYRNSCMYDVTTGKYEVEKVVSTKTRGDKVQVDTTYYFYRNKEK